MYLLLVISQQPYHLGTSNHFHLHPLMQCHALQLAITASLHHGKPYKGSLWWLCTIIATTLGTTWDVPSFGHISTTIPPLDLKRLSSASSDAVPCITVAITASSHHGKPYKGSLWWLCTIIATTLGTTLHVPSFGHISTITPRDLKP